MADCKLLEGCPFYNDHMEMTGGLGALYKSKYCTGEFATCARYIVFQQLGRAAVPQDLYPNMGARADEIIAGSKPRS